MSKCPNCGFVNPSPVKNWRYGNFTVQAYTCGNCGTQYREYYDKSGKLSFVLKLQKGKGFVKA
jgi:transposase